MLRRDIAGLGGMGTRAGVGGGGYAGAPGAVSYTWVPGSSCGRMRSVRAMLPVVLKRLGGREGMGLVGRINGVWPALGRSEGAGLVERMKGVWPGCKDGAGLRERDIESKGLGLAARERGGTDGRAIGECMKPARDAAGLPVGPMSRTVEAPGDREGSSYSARAGRPGVTGPGYAGPSNGAGS